MKVACLVATVAAAQHLFRGCDMQTVFADMHDGDEKEVTIKGTNMTIKPYANNQTWVVHTVINCKTRQAIVDFNVPGKKDHPPVPLTATLFTSLSRQMYGTPKRKRSFVYTDPSGTLVDDATYPLNQWVEAKTVVDRVATECPEKLSAVFADMHDGDKKEVIIDGDSMTIKPSGNDQEWTVNAKLNRMSCTAVIDFNVSGKPAYPPVNLTATYWRQYATKKSIQNTFEFTDPSGTLARADHPLNSWIQLTSKLVGV